MAHLSAVGVRVRDTRLPAAPCVPPSCLPRRTPHTPFTARDAPLRAPRALFGDRRSRLAPLPLPREPQQASSGVHASQAPPGSRALQRAQEQQSAGRSGGFAWLLGRKSRADAARPDPAQLAAKAFGDGTQRELDEEALREPSIQPARGWAGPSAPAAAWNSADLAQPRGMEEEEEEEAGVGGRGTQLTRNDGFVIHHFKNGWYKGDVSNGVINGRGHFAFANGESYDGDWVDNRMSGRGKYTYVDGSFFEGVYLDGKKHGLGRYTPALGEPYMIYYKDGLPLQSGEAVVCNDDYDEPFLTTLTRDRDDEDLQGFNNDEPMGVGMKFAPGFDGGLVVSEIVPGGTAHQDGRIEVGDRLYAVAGTKVGAFAVADVLKLVQNEYGIPIIQLEFEREIGDGAVTTYTVNLARQLDGEKSKPKSVLARLRPSRQLYHMPKTDVDNDSDDGVDGAGNAGKVEEEEEEEAEEEGEEEPAPVREQKSLTMEEVCEEVRKARMQSAQLHQPKGEDKDKRNELASNLWDDEDPEQHEDDEDEDIDEQLVQLDPNGPATVPPEMVYIYISMHDMHRMIQDEGRRYRMIAKLLTEVSDIIACSFDILSIHSIEPTLVTKGLMNNAEVLGATIRMPENRKQWRHGDSYDKDSHVVAVRVGLLIHIRGTGTVVPPRRVEQWQREKAEWVEQAFDVHLRGNSWEKYHYLRHAKKVELVGHWNLERDCRLVKLATDDLLEKQLSSMEETQAIWSKRFTRRYGNPLLMVLSHKESIKITRNQANQPVTKREAEKAFMFTVRKKLNAFSDGPRLFIVDMANRCIENWTVGAQDEEEEDSVSKKKIDPKKKKRSNNKLSDMGGKLRKKLTFDDFKMIEPHPSRDTRVTIKFKTMQHDYIFDFVDSHDREVFVMKMKGLLPSNVFAPEVQLTEQLRPNSYHESRVSDPNIFSVTPLHSLLLNPMLSGFFLSCLVVSSLFFSSPLFSSAVFCFLLLAYCSL